MNVYKIPVRYKTGEFNVSQIEPCLFGDSENIEITLDEYDILSYNVPHYGNKVRIYSVSKSIADTMTAVYGDNGIIDNVSMTVGNSEKLVYIHFDNDESAKENIFCFSHYWADKISEEILSRKEKLSRVFTEHFYDGEAVDFAVKTASAKDVEEVESKYGKDAVNNSGDYKNRITCDNETLGIMIKCSDLGYELFGFAVYLMENSIKEQLMEKAEKENDFEFISQEYD